MKTNPKGFWLDRAGRVNRQALLFSRPVVGKQTFRVLSQDFVIIGNS